MKTAAKPSPTPPPTNTKPAGRLPQRSEAVAGQEANGESTPIPAAQPKPPTPQ